MLLLLQQLLQLRLLGDQHLSLHASISGNDVLCGPEANEQHTGGNYSGMSERAPLIYYLDTAFCSLLNGQDI